MSEQAEGVPTPELDPAQAPVAGPVIDHANPVPSGSTEPTPEVAQEENAIQQGRAGDEGELVMPFVDPAMLAAIMEMGFMEVFLLQ